MKISTFAKIKTLNDVSMCVAITAKPSWCKLKLKEATELFPSSAMMQRGYTHDDYIELLQKRQLKPRQVYKKYKDCILITDDKRLAQYILEWLNTNLKMEDVLEDA